MKYLITERQLKLIKEQDEILELDFDFFNNNWDILQRFVKRRGNPPYIITGNLYLENTDIKSLGNLQSVGGELDLYKTNIQSLGNLQSVGGFLNLTYSEIQSLGNLQYVGGSLGLRNTSLSETTTTEEIRNIPNLTIEGEIYL